MRDFRKLIAWQKADDLAVVVYRVTSEAFPKHELYGLTSQMRRAAVSVAANIVEGAGKQYLSEFRQFLYIARGSVQEVEYYVHLATRLDYLNEMQRASLTQAQSEAARTLQGFINTVEDQIAGGRREN